MSKTARLLSRRWVPGVLVATAALMAGGADRSSAQCCSLHRRSCFVRLESLTYERLFRLNLRPDPLAQLIILRPQRGILRQRLKP